MASAERCRLVDSCEPPWPNRIVAIAGAHVCHAAHIVVEHKSYQLCDLSFTFGLKREDAIRHCFTVHYCSIEGHGGCLEKHLMERRTCYTIASSIRPPCTTVR